MAGSSILAQLRASPIATACLFIGIFLLVRSMILNRKKTLNIPGIRYGSIPGLRSWIGAYNFMKDPTGVLQEGYTKYRNSYFRVSDIGQEYILVNDPEKVAEYLSAPDSVLNVQDAINIGIQFEWTMGPGFYYRPYHIPIVRTKLTGNVGTVLPKMQMELEGLLDAEIGSPKEWTEVAIHDRAIDMIARLSNLALGGQPLAHNDEYVKIAIQYTIDLMLSAQFLKPLPTWAKTQVNYLLPAYKSKKRCERIIGSYVDQRLKATDDGKPQADDMLQWLIDSAPPVERTTPQLVERLLGVNVAAIHTTTMTLTNAIYTLCEQPSKYLTELRAEVDQHCGDGHFTKESMDACTKLDSFLRECGRVSSIGLVGSGRYARSDYTFKDGTVVPAGYILAGSIPALHQLNNGDAPGPEFDGFRYSREVEEGGQKQSQAITTGPEYLAFGHGRHACPGRYFADTCSNSEVAVSWLFAGTTIYTIQGLLPSSSKLLKLTCQLMILLFQVFNALLQGLHLFFCACAKFFDDLEDSPQTQNNDDGAHFLQRASKHDVDDEARNDDCSIHAVEP